MFHLIFLNGIKSIILGIFAIVRRAFCCFSRKRRQSYSDCEILTSVNVVDQGSYQNNRRTNEVERDWNSWDDSPRTVDEHIEQYRQRLVQPKTIENAEPALDFFHDMEPKVLKQQKLFINTKNNDENPGFSRLQPTTIASFGLQQSAELADWSDHDDEDAATGWDDDGVDDAAKELIRQKRREQRAQRNQRLQQQKLQKTQSHGSFSYHA